MSEPLTPNVKRMMIERMSQLQIERAKRSLKPGGSVIGAVAIGLLDVEAVKVDAREAMAWTRQALHAIRTAPGGEAFKTDEDAAAELMRLLDERARRNGAKKR